MSQEKSNVFNKKELKNLLKIFKEKDKKLYLPTILAELNVSKSDLDYLLSDFSKFSDIQITFDENNQVQVYSKLG